MARFDVYPYSDAVPFLVDAQADLLADFRTRVVTPLLSYAPAQTGYHSQGQKLYFDHNGCGYNLPPSGGEKNRGDNVHKKEGRPLQDAPLFISSSRVD